MADFPASIYEPRTMQNLPGLTRDVADTKNLFAEDYNEAMAEIVAIEETLGLDPQGGYDTVEDRIFDLEDIVENEKGINNLADTAFLSANFSLSAANGVYEDTGLSITLPSAGTYLVFYTARAVIIATGTPYWFIRSKLYNSTDSADVSNSILLALIANTPSDNHQNTATVALSITVSSAKTLKLYASRTAQGGGSFTISQIGSDVNGKSSISYIKVA